MKTENFRIRIKVPFPCCEISRNWTPCDPSSCTSNLSSVSQDRKNRNTFTFTLDFEAYPTYSLLKHVTTGLIYNSFPSNSYFLYSSIPLVAAIYNFLLKPSNHLHSFQHINQKPSSMKPFPFVFIGLLLVKVAPP